MKHSAFLLVSALLVGSTALAFDWTGKFEQDVADLKSPSADTRLQALRRLARYSTERSQKYLLSALQDSDSRVRLEAAAQSSEHRLAAAVPLLSRWLSHGDTTIRATGAEALGKIGAPSAMKALVRSLSDPEPNVRHKVAAALGEIHTLDGQEILPLLGRLNGETNSTVRKAVVEALARKRDRRALIPLLARLSDSSSEVRQAAVLALGELGDAGAGPPLVRLIRDSNPGVAGAAISVVGRLRYAGATEPLVDLFRGGSYVHRSNAAAALGALGTPIALHALVEALGRSTHEPAARKALVDAGNKAAAQVVAALGDPRTPQSVVRAIVEICREGRITDAVPALVAQLRSGRLPRILLVQTLGHLADPRAQRPLLESLDDPAPDLRLAALQALDRLLDERCAEPLLPLLRDPSPPVQQTAVRYLGRLRARIATDPMLRLASSPDPQIARSAVLALAEARDPRGAVPLARLLSSKDRELRRLVSQALARLHDRATLGPILDLCQAAAPDTRLTCLQALGGVLRNQTDEAAWALLSRTAEQHDRSLFLSAMDALAAMRDPRIPEFLMARYATLDVPLRRRAVEALGTAGGQGSATIPFLSGILGDPDVSLRSTAAWALGQLQPSSVEAKLTQAARDRRWETRTNAVAALARLKATRLRPLFRALATDDSPYVRANALLALALTGDATATALLVDRLQSDRSPWVRASALRGLLLLAPPKAVSPDGRGATDVAKHLAAVATEDPDPRVRSVAASLRSARSTGQPDSWITLYLMDQEEQPLRNGSFVLITPSGLVKAAWSDGLGEAWVEGLEEGRCFVELPQADSETGQPARE